MTRSSPPRTPTAVLIAGLGLVQATFAVFRALGFVQIGSDLIGRSILQMPLGVLVFARAAQIGVTALLYGLFAWGTLAGRPWTRTVGLLAAALNLLLVLSAVIQGTPVVELLPWCIVP